MWKKMNLKRLVMGWDLTTNITCVFLSPHSRFRDRNTQNSETNHISTHALQNLYIRESCWCWQPWWFRRRRLSWPAWQARPRCVRRRPAPRMRCKYLYGCSWDWGTEPPLNLLHHRPTSAHLHRYKHVCSHWCVKV